MQSSARVGSSHEIVWPVWLMILGVMLAFFAWATQNLGPWVGDGVQWLRWALRLGLAALAVGAMGLIVRRVLAMRGTQMLAGWLGLLAWPGIVIGLLAAFALAVLPVPWRWQWVSTVATLICVLGALALGLLLARAGPSPLIREARRELAEGQKGRAKELLEQVDAAADDYYLHEAWARIHRREGRFEAALTCADRMVMLRPDLCFGHLECGAARIALGRTKDGLSALEEATRIAPCLAQAHLYLGVARAEAGDKHVDPLLAAESLSRALRLGLREDVARLIARYYLIGLFQKLDAPERARREWRRLSRGRGTLKQWRAAAGELALPLSPRRTSAKLANDIERTMAAPPVEH